jgi:hypothetical protein
MVNHISYQSNHSYHNNQVMYSSNRSRTESGSSESSRGSGNSGNSGNSSGNSGRSRRRSHRPRGCRGGSNRRRHNSGEGRNKQQLYNKTTYNNDFKSRVQGKFSRPSMNHNGPPEEELLVTNGQQYCDPNSFRRPSYSNQSNATKDFNYRLPEYTYPPSGISVSSQSDFHHSGIASSRNINSHYYRDTSAAYNGEPENDYPMLQSSFSESSSSSETIFEEHDVAYAQSQQQQQQQHQQRQQRQQQDQDQDQDQGHGQILPPLPSNALFHHPKQIPFGPNPYALKTSGSSNSNSNSNSTTISSSNNIFTTPSSVIERSVTRQSIISVVDTTMNLPGILQRSNNNHTEFDYRAQRLEKQRQNVVGGSLFVTSPRSFLMSCKK